MSQNSMMSRLGDSKLQFPEMARASRIHQRLPDSFTYTFGNFIKQIRSTSRSLWYQRNAIFQEREYLKLKHHSQTRIRSFSWCRLRVCDNTLTNLPKFSTRSDKLNRNQIWSHLQTRCRVKFNNTPSAGIPWKRREGQGFTLASFRATNRRCRWEILQIAWSAPAFIHATR